MEGLCIHAFFWCIRWYTHVAGQKVKIRFVFLSSHILSHRQNPMGNYRFTASSWNSVFEALSVRTAVLYSKGRSYVSHSPSVLNLFSIFCIFGWLHILGPCYPWRSAPPRACSFLEMVHNLPADTPLRLEPSPQPPPLSNSHRPSQCFPCPQSPQPAARPALNHPSQPPDSWRPSPWPEPADITQTIQS